MHGKTNGLVVLDPEWGIESASTSAQRWLDDLPDGDRARDTMPSAVITLAARTMRGTGVTVSRVLSRSGVWVVLHGALLTSTKRPRVAVILDPAHPNRIYPLLMAAYGLTERKKEVTRLVSQGASTAQTAADLTVSAYTVQQHLKSIFDKTGVHSRGELVGTVFLARYEPRFRDNEQRVRDRLPMRGEPWPKSPQAVAASQPNPSDSMK